MRTSLIIQKPDGYWLPFEGDTRQLIGPYSTEEEAREAEIYDRAMAMYSHGSQGDWFPPAGN